FAARVQIEAFTIPPQKGKAINVVATVANVGFVVQSQAALNMVRISALTHNTSIPLYNGAGNLTNKIVPPNYYGKDGLEDVEGWTNQTGPIDSTPGYIAMANLIVKATPENPITFLITSPLTEVAKAFSYLLQTDPTGSFAQNINALIIRGGCIYPDANNTFGCNAPYNVLDKSKNSEINFYSDVEAIQNVTDFCNEHNIPRVLLPLGLTQVALWTKEQQKELETINNSVAKKLAEVLKIVPAPDARRFPADTYPLHDFFAAVAVARPDLFEAIKVAITIGDVGQILINETASDEQKLVYLLSLPEDVQATFFESVLPELNKFTCFLDPTLDICNPGVSLDLILKIAIPAGAGSILILLVVACVLQRKKARELARKNRELTETSRLLDQTAQDRNRKGQLLEQRTGEVAVIDAELAQTALRLEQERRAREEEERRLKETQKKLTQTEQELQATTDAYQHATKIVFVDFPDDQAFEDEKDE
ncbi:MAG: nucleoside hydrolase, partial [Verrucomicrobia bacterium]|nr:nucleoside hydrolase [Verrucomicrobiota bacterium]